MTTMHGSRLRAALIASMLLSASVVLAGCVPAQTPPTRSAVTPTSSVPTPTGTAAGVPVYKPNGSAAENLPYFKLVGHALLDHHESANGRTIIDWLVSHGFNKKDMEITPDKTSIGLDAWNIEFSVKMKDSTCLIGQAGNVNFRAFATTDVSTGKCLIGKTRTINW
jgi:hypothetical protein